VGLTKNNTNIFFYNQVVELLLEHGANVNSVNSHKHIPLHLAAQNGHLNLSKLLIDAGSKVDAADLIGNKTV
jgi:ankyrin repeat protein